MCERPATSREHVPPRCLFPESRDIPGTQLRANLITVPSCDLHNGMKSKDDEFLMVCLAGILGNNSIGYHHKFTKVDRALRRSSLRLLDKVFVRRKLYTFKVQENLFIEVIWGTPDQPRLLRCFDHLARGLYFHHFGMPLFGDVKPYLRYLTPSEANGTEFKRLIDDKATADLEGKPRFGANPDVFFYQLTDPDPYGLRLLHLCFYTGLSIYCAIIPAGVEIFDLAFELMNAGIRTTLKDGENSYEFNVASEDESPA